MADVAERTAYLIKVGQGATEVLEAARSAMVGLVHSSTVIDRIGRLEEGSVELESVVAPLRGWGSVYRLGANTGLAFTLSTTMQPLGPSAPPMSLLLLDTALVSAGGTEFVVPLQRTPLLID